MGNQMNGCMEAAGLATPTPPPAAYPAPNNVALAAPPTLDVAPGGAAKSMKIIGITGTIGAGKGTVVEYLMKPPHNFKHYSARTLLNKIIAEKGLPEGRDSLRMVANELREERGPAAVIEALYEMAEQVGEDAIIESVRTEGEVVCLRKKAQFALLAVDADQKIRYDRVHVRGSDTDDVTFEKFCEQEATEMTSTKPTEQNLGRCIDLADGVLRNDTTVEDFQTQIDVFLLGMK